MEKKIGTQGKGQMPAGKPGQSPIGPPSVAKPTVADTPDPTEAWIAANPAGKEFTPSAEPVQAQLPIAPDPATDAASDAATPQATSPDAGTPPSDTADSTPSQSSPIHSAATTDAAPTDSTPPAVTPPSDAAAPPAQPQGDKPAAPAQPAAVEPTRVSPDGKYAFAEGAEPWTGEQVIAALRERSELQPKAAEAEGFRQFFGGDLAEAQARWTPVLQSIQAHPDRVPLLEDLLNTTDQAKVNYLLESSRFYDAETGGNPGAAPAAAAPAAAPAQPQYAKLDPATAARLEAFEKAQAHHEAERQWNDALTRYPVLKSRAELRNSLLELFNAMYARDPKTTLYDALRVNAPLYESLNIAAAQGGAAPAVPQAQPSVPALNGSPGATPTGARPSVDNRPKKFDDVNDAVDDWISQNP